MKYIMTILAALLISGNAFAGDKDQDRKYHKKSKNYHEASYSGDRHHSHEYKRHHDRHHYSHKTGKHGKRH